MSDKNTKKAAEEAEELEKKIKQLTDSLTSLEKFSNLEFNMDFSSIGGAINSLTQIDGGIKNIMVGFQTFKSGGFNNIFSELANSGSPLAQLYTTLNNGILSCIPSLAAQTTATAASAGATTVATGATTAFGAALTFLQANPLVAVIGALGLVVGALALFGDNETEAEKQTRLFNEAQEAKRNELIETSKAINESTAAAVGNAKNAEIQSEVLSGFVGNLKGLADENGFVKNFEEAQYYVDEINSAMPGTVELTEDGRLTWLQNAEAIDENIKQLERKAKVEAYYDGYVESLKNETKLRGELTLAQNNYNTELEKQQEYQNKVNELMALSREGLLTPEQTEQLTNYNNLLQESNGNLEGYSRTLDKAKGAYEANTKGAELYQQAVGALDESVTASALLQAEEYTVLEENGTSTWGSLAAASEDCKNRVTTAQGEELATVQATSAIIQAEMVNKALTQGMTCDQMLKQLEDSGVKMNETEKEQLKMSYEQWSMNSEDIKNAQAKGLDTLKLMKMTALTEMSTDEKAKLAESVKQFAENGDKSGIALCNKLSESLEANNGEINAETKKIIDIINNIDDVDPKVIAQIIKPTDKEVQNVKDQFDKIPKNMVTKWMVRGEDGEVTFKYTPKYQLADGGFVPSGELFVAREAGPELVGRINGKTAVANNDQIVSGISSGVYNAVRSAMSGNGGNANMNIHATFVMDGEVVGKQVIKYHNGVVKRTGTTPLMI